VRNLPTIHLALWAIAFALTAAVNASGAEVATVPFQLYATTLQRVVTPEGRVRYAALKGDPAGLDAFLASLAAGNRAELAQLPETDRIAFWINAYNAITLKTIIDHYPIHGRGLSALRFPASSIRQISGAWSNRDWTVLGTKMSLDDIEHETLRRQFHEPRIHMALVCAALGCPLLRNEPYQGAHLNEQLDDQARRYLASPAGLQLEAGGHEVTVSSIFKWFASDFESSGGVRAFLARYAPEAARGVLAGTGATITYLRYDWTLNEAQGD
jgi:hypothetical protein